MSSDKDPHEYKTRRDIIRERKSAARPRAPKQIKHSKEQRLVDAGIMDELMDIFPISRKQMKFWWNYRMSEHMRNTFRAAHRKGVLRQVAQETVIDR